VLTGKLRIAYTKFVQKVMQFVFSRRSSWSQSVRTGSVRWGGGTLSFTTLPSSVFSDNTKHDANNKENGSLGYRKICSPPPPKRSICRGGGVQINHLHSHCNLERDFLALKYFKYFSCRCWPSVRVSNKFSVRTVFCVCSSDYNFFVL
jgi:hypothetical protein